MQQAHDEAVAAASGAAAPTLAGRIRALRVGDPLRRFVSRSWSERQHRNTAYLLLNNVFAAATGLLFWLLIARLNHLSTATIGVGYTIIAIGTLVGVVAKGGLDTALVRNLPQASRSESNRLLRLALAIGCAAALTISVGLAVLSLSGLALTDIRGDGWLLATLIALLLVVTWLQDAHFLADGDARHSFHRNAVFGVSRLLFPVALVAIAAPQPVALSWAIALAMSAGVAALLSLQLPPRAGSTVPNERFLRSAARNISGSAAEFVPGLLLAPMVLAIQGPEAAAYFGIAWTAASLLFLASSAISRSALAELVRRLPHEQAATLRRGVRQHLALVVPGAVACALLAPWLLRVFGQAYADNAAGTLTILAASILVVAPAYYYLAYLRAQERPVALLLFPLGMVAALAVLAPPLAQRLGIEGVALAWFLANTPFAAYAVWRLRHLAREVTLKHGPAPGLAGAPHPE